MKNIGLLPCGDVAFLLCPGSEAESTSAEQQNGAFCSVETSEEMDGVLQTDEDFQLIFLVADGRLWVAGCW